VTYVMTKPCPICKRQLTKHQASAYRYRALQTAVESLARIHSPTFPLQEEPSLNLCEFHGCTAFFVVVGHVVDPSAYGIALHQPSIVGLQPVGGRTHECKLPQLPASRATHAGREARTSIVNH
jgi:hypothetical protein